MLKIALQLPQKVLVRYKINNNILIRFIKELL